MGIAVKKRFLPCTKAHKGLELKKKKTVKKKNMMNIERGLQQTLMLQNHSNISSGSLLREGKLKRETGALIAAAREFEVLRARLHSSVPKEEKSVRVSRFFRYRRTG